MKRQEAIDFLMDYYNHLHDQWQSTPEGNYYAKAFREAIVTLTKNNPDELSEEDKHILYLLKYEGLINAIKWFRNTKGISIPEARQYVENIKYNYL